MTEASLYEGEIVTMMSDDDFYGLAPQMTFDRSNIMSSGPKIASFSDISSYRPSTANTRCASLRSEATTLDSGFYGSTAALSESRRRAAHFDCADVCGSVQQESGMNRDAEDESFPSPKVCLLSAFDEVSQIEFRQAGKQCVARRQAPMRSCRVNQRRSLDTMEHMVSHSEAARHMGHSDTARHRNPGAHRNRLSLDPSTVRQLKLLEFCVGLESNTRVDLEYNMKVSMESSSLECSSKNELEECQMSMECSGLESSVLDYRLNPHSQTSAESLSTSTNTSDTCPNSDSFLFRKPMTHIPVGTDCGNDEILSHDVGRPSDHDSVSLSARFSDRSSLGLSSRRCSYESTDSGFYSLHASSLLSDSRIRNTTDCSVVSSIHVPLTIDDRRKMNDVKELNEEERERLNAVIDRVCPAVRDRLIGRKVGLDHVDFVGELAARNMTGVISVMFGFLSEHDLMR